MKIFKYVPVFTYILIVYNLFALLIHTDIQGFLSSQLLTLPLVSGAVFTLYIKDLFLFAGVVALYIEVLKATKTTELSIIDHALSMLVFVIFLVEFIVLAPFGTSTFFILTLMSMLDVIAGFTVTISSARRDFGVHE